MRDPTHALQDFLDRLERDAALRRPDRVRERADALDRLELLLLGRDRAAGEETCDLDQRVRTLRDRFGAADAVCYSAIRNEIRLGRGAERLRALAASNESEATACAPGENYDALDEWVSGILRLAPPEAEAIALAPEMVRYQPTPARHVFDLIARTALDEDDVVVDLGSGLGHVPLIVAIATKARAIGIELEPAYVECARRAGEALGLDRVRFVLADARSADFSTGTLFYLYTPFSGSILRSVLDALREEARGRAFRVCAFGPCVAALTDEKWLDVIGIAATDRVTLFRTRGC